MTFIAHAHLSRPFHEAFFAPMEGTAEGEIVFDGSIGDIGKLSAPVRLVVQKGIAKVITDSEAARKFDQLLSGVGPEAYQIAELGVGTNDRAEIHGTIHPNPPRPRRRPSSSSVFSGGTSKTPAACFLRSSLSHPGKPPRSATEDEDDDEED